mgnify:CR=1 FL=1
MYFLENQWPNPATPAGGRMISYSDIKGHYFYKIKEVKRMLEERLIKRDKECINELITNHQKYVKERRNTKQDK